MFNKEELTEWLEEIGKRTAENARIYVIGGAALAFRGLKTVTKDIDIVVADEIDFKILNKAIKEAGFKPVTDLKEEFYLTALAVYEKGDSRIDVFLEQVGKMLNLTESMINREKHIKDYGNLSTILLSNEDIFLFKLMSSRVGDIYDCDRLMKEGLNYNDIYDELIEQSKKKDKWFFWAFESLCKLEEMNSIQTPLKGKILFLVKKHWNEKPKDFMAEVKDAKKHLG